MTCFTLLLDSPLEEPLVSYRDGVGAEKVEDMGNLVKGEEGEG